MGTITYGAVLQNEVKAWPPLVQIGSGFDLVTNAQWFDDVGTPTTKASAVPVSGEAGLDTKFTEVIKCVTDAVDEGWLQRYTYAEEPRIKAGTHISAAIWVGSTGGGVDVTVKLLNSDASETVGTLVLTDGDWDLYVVEDHTCAGTYVDLHVTKDTTGTFYAGGPMTVMIGADVVGLPPRHLRYRLCAAADTAVENLTGSTTKAYGDVDLTAQSSPLAAIGDFHAECAEGTTGLYGYNIRPNWENWAGPSTLAAATNVAIKAGAEPSDVERISNDFTMILDDQQIIETGLANSGGGSVDNCRLYMQGYWEWE